MKASTLFQGLLPSVVFNDWSQVTKLSSDSRQLDEDTVFLAACGQTRHALDYLSPTQTYSKVVYEPPYTPVQTDWLPCEDLGAHLSLLGARFYQHPSQQMTMIGITGTDGKSSLVHLSAQALGCAMIGTIGNGRLSALQTASLTTPDALSVQRLLAQYQQQGIETVAMEVSSHALDQHRVAAVDFDVALFSNLSRDHLDYHTDLEDYFNAKAKLFAMPIRHAIVNIDDAYGRRLITENRIHAKAQLWTVSSHDNQPPCASRHLSASDIVLHDDGITFDLSVNGQTQTLNSRLLARFNVDNLLNVAAVLAVLDYSLPQIITHLSALEGVPGRVERFTLPNGGNAIVDYAHTAGALESVLCGVRPHVRGKLWLVFGCGGDRDKGKRALMAQAAQRFADRVVMTDDNPRTEDPNHIINDMLADIEQTDAIAVVQPREQAIVFALEQLSADDVLVIAGKGHEDYQIIGTDKHYFSDQAVIAQFIAQSAGKA